MFDCWLFSFHWCSSLQDIQEIFPNNTQLVVDANNVVLVAK
ncbi:hypothetical protein B6N60_04810 [Richelia sinica FACHB-800]|uniref:Uncharacterized protein n=1 Tax=Richelia sinica FACHB-800 TaxID=1357546 RepID=A0A975TCI4_9NOST|nr:hypothetical protein B6N60_04810 [Richelia sinica FACHB-800]